MRWRLQQPRDKQIWHVASCFQVEQSLMEAKALQRPRATPHWAVSSLQAMAGRQRPHHRRPLSVQTCSPDQIISSQGSKELKEKRKYSVSEATVYNQREYNPQPSLRRLWEDIRQYQQVKRVLEEGWCADDTLGRGWMFQLKSEEDNHTTTSWKKKNHPRQQELRITE